MLERAIGELPPPQRRALEIALLFRDAERDAPDQGAIAFGFLSIVRAIADAPVILAVDDAMFAEMTSLWALALLELSLENPAEAHRCLGPLVERVEAGEVGEPGSIRFVFDDIEALLALGELEPARTILDRFEERARRLGRRSGLAAAQRCRGLLASRMGDDHAAIAALTEAFSQLETLPLPFERARTLLALGSVRRRAHRRREAREALEQAFDLFTELGASLWSQRVRAELQRVSGRPPPRGELTASEHRIAELVAEGQTNKEVAAALHLAERTVEGTLSRVYTKLGVRSRSELARYWATRN